jgi:hypothetical protein
VACRFQPVDPLIQQLVSINGVHWAPEHTPIIPSELRADTASQLNCRFCGPAHLMTLQQARMRRDVPQFTQSLLQTCVMQHNVGEADGILCPLHLIVSGKPCCWCFAMGMLPALRYADTPESVEDNWTSILGLLLQKFHSSLLSMWLNILPADFVRFHLLAPFQCAPALTSVSRFVTEAYTMSTCQFISLSFRFYTPNA